MHLRKIEWCWWCYILFIHTLIISFVFKPDSNISLNNIQIELINNKTSRIDNIPNPKYVESDRLLKPPQKLHKIAFEWKYSCFLNDDVGDDNNNNIYHNELWSKCFNSNDIQNYSVSNDGFYINKVVNSNKISFFTISTCKRNPKYLDSDKCNLGIHSFLICNDFYLINDAFYPRNTTICKSLLSDHYTNCCQWIDIMFFWSYIVNNNIYYNNYEWIALFEDDISFCSDLFKFIWNIIGNSDCSKLNNINRIEFSTGGLGHMLRVKNIKQYLKLINLLWNILINPSTSNQIYIGLDTAITNGITDNKLNLKNGAYDYGYYYVTNGLIWHPMSTPKQSYFGNGWNGKIQKPPICYFNTSKRMRHHAIKWINPYDLKHPYWF